LILGGGLAAALLTVCAVFVVMFVGGMSACSYDVKDQKVAPDGSRKAALVDVNCGATTGYVTWVVMTKTASPFRYRRDRVAAISGRAARIEWDGSKLVVFHPATQPPNVDRDHAGVVLFRPL
jgi:hypothetical protein